MKKIILAILFLTAIFVSCKKDQKEDNPPDNSLTPVQQQWGFALNYTATWCFYCGQWGAPLIHQFADTGNVVAITAHAQGDPMYNSALYGNLSAVRPDGGGIPSFWVGDIATTDIASMTALLAQSPVAAIAIQSEKIGDSLSVNTKVRFYEAGSGEFYLSVLILEDGIDGSGSAGEYAQNGTSNPDTYCHDFVLMASNAGGNAYGEMILSNPEAGTEITKHYSIYVSGSWVNIYPVAILWRLDMFGYPVYSFVNAVK